MKIVIGLLLLYISIGAGQRATAAECTGRAYTSLDDGRFAYSIVRAQYVGVPLSSSNEGRYVRFVFDSDRKSHWKTYRYQNEPEMLQGMGYYSPYVGMSLADLRFDEATVSHFRDRVVVGMNLLCRI